MKSVQYLEMVKKKYSLKTDSELAKILDKSQNTISQYMSGKRVMDDETCLAVALKLEVNPLEIVGAACIDRAEKTGQKSLWEVFMTRTAQTASALLFVFFVNLFLTTDAANAATARVSKDGILQPINYANQLQYTACCF